MALWHGSRRRREALGPMSRQAQYRERKLKEELQLQLKEERAEFATKQEMLEALCNAASFRPKLKQLRSRKTVASSKISLIERAATGKPAECIAQ